MSAFGVGYQNRSIGEFRAALVAAGGQVVVDVRLNPISRKPGFSRRALAGELATVGIDYVHEPALGNPKDNRAGFTGTADERDAARQRYEHVLDSPAAREALDRVAALACGHCVAVLCFEAEQRQCHRDLVLERLRAKGIRVHP